MTNIEEVRNEVAKMGGTVSDPLPMANWIEMHGVFTPDQLRKLAKTVEKKYVNTQRSQH